MSQEPTAVLDPPVVTAETPAAPEPTRETVPAGTSYVFAGLLIGLALFSSGAAGLVNQVVWQRSLKVFLGGSESICSMIVVLVFMGGLGAGSVWMGGRAARLKNPLKTFGILEATLAVVNLGICGLLSIDISRSVFAFQNLAVSLGVPLLLLYAVSAVVILVIPCLLMGATMPLAAEACQRNLGITDSRLLGLLFFINTLGSVAGTVVSSGYMMSHLGLSTSLLMAAGMNLAAGALLIALMLSARSQRVRADVGYASAYPSSADGVLPHREMLKHHLRPSFEEVLAFGLGFCSLGYEMYLFRVIPLRHEPLPFTFAAVLTGFLLFWSAGAALSARKRRLTLSTALRICGLTTVASVVLFVVDSQSTISGTWSLMRFVVLRFPYFIPCLFFGYLFGLVAARAARSWGRDVGRLYGWNTAGACLGILGMTFVGYEIPFFMMAAVIGLLLFAMQEYAAAHDGPGSRTNRPALPRWLAPAAGAVAAVVVPFFVDMSGLMSTGKMYSAADGVIIVDDSGNMVWDGLWHSKLSQDDDHIGTNNWYLAVCPVLCHPTGDIKDVCVIGVATGITASTLSRSSAVDQIDAYDISRVLKRIYRDYPEGTLNIADNPKINIIWQDARTGLALNEKKYDVIQTQPLYLKQAGSALLNSVEFYRLCSRRLKPGGVFCLYSNALGTGAAEQALVVRQTAARAFPYHVSFFNGYLLVLSNDPITVSEELINGRYRKDDPLWQEIRNWPPTADGAHVLQLIDSPSLFADRLPLVVTDDRPIVEYPHYLAEEVKRLGYTGPLPKPVFGKADRDGTHSK